MKARPILFSAPMIRALLDGRKTQTRRGIRPQPVPYVGGVHPKLVAKHPAPYIDAYCSEKKSTCNPRGMSVNWCWWSEDDRQGSDIGRCPYGAPGDLLWARETTAFWWEDGKTKRVLGYRADVNDWDGFGADDPRWLNCDWEPSIHMPRWASRLTLEIDDVRLEPLQDISEQDARAEGSYLGRCDCAVMQQKPRNAMEALFQQTGCYIHGDEFKALWKSLHRAPSWEQNPFVWALTFRVHQQNVDAFLNQREVA